VQLAFLIGLFVLLKAFAYFTDRFELLYSTRNTKFNGATYTDLNALLPAKLILLCIAVFCALAFFAGAFLRNLQLPAIALALLVLSSVLIGAAWPAIMQQSRSTRTRCRRSRCRSSATWTPPGRRTG